MCLIALAWRCHWRYDLVFVGNRDEYYARPAAPAAWWPAAQERPPLLAGRDLEAGGTWLGVRADGAFATVTNLRAPGARRSGAVSRGRLVTGYLLDAPGQVADVDASPVDAPDGAGAADGDVMHYLHAVAARGEDFAHFNLLAGRLSTPASLAYLNNVDGTPRRLDAGVHVLSNDRLGRAWPKTTRSDEGLRRLLEDAAGEDEDTFVEALLALLADPTPAPPESLPQTGLTPAQELALSPPFIAIDGYGTRATTVMLAGRDGRVRFVEQRYGPGGRADGRVDTAFEVAGTDR